MSSSSSGQVEDVWPLSHDFDAYDALLFDLDGTLVDTMPLHGLAYAAVFEGLGHRFTLDDYLAHVGPPARVAIPAFAQAVGMGAIDDAMIAHIHGDKKLRFKEVLAREKAPSLATSALLARHAGRKPMALVSSGNRDGVEAILGTMGWREYFGAVVSGDDVRKGKPDAEPYLTAARLLGLDAARCLVFEDTEAGIKSGLAAGMSVIDVTQDGVIHRPGIA
jgi:HAD superfamily hydrolase (TIGR01509 family)